MCQTDYYLHWSVVKLSPASPGSTSCSLGAGGLFRTAMASRIPKTVRQPKTTTNTTQLVDL